VTRETTRRLVRGRVAAYVSTYVEILQK